MNQAAASKSTNAPIGAPQRRPLNCGAPVGYRRTEGQVWLLLHEGRRRKRLSLRALAQILGVNTSTVLRWEQLETVPLATQERALADALGISLATVRKDCARRRRASGRKNSPQEYSAVGDRNSGGGQAEQA